MQTTNLRTTALYSSNQILYWVFSLSCNRAGKVNTETCQILCKRKKSAICGCRYRVLFWKLCNKLCAESSSESTRSIFNTSSAGFPLSWPTFYDCSWCQTTWGPNLVLFATAAIYTPVLPVLVMNHIT